MKLFIVQAFSYFACFPGLHVSEPGEGIENLLCPRGEVGIAITNDGMMASVVESRPD
jgi:hypothetical protein